MTEVKYSTHIYDLSIKRVDTPINLGGKSINVLAVNGDCFIKINDKSQDPINLLHTANIKTEFTKFYLSNNIQVGGYVAIVVGSHCEFEIKTNIARATHKPLLLPPQNIPEHLINRAIDTPKIINIWDIENAVLRHTFNTTAQDTSPTSLFFKPDGLKVYTIGRIHDNINEYDLSTAWDISTAVFRHSFSVALQTTHPSGLFFNPDGTKMYIIDGGTTFVYQYALNTSWDVTTATHQLTLDVAPQTQTAWDIAFSPIGHKMYILAMETNNIIEYDLSTSWDISTAIFKHSFNIAAHIEQPRNMFFSPDGLKFYIIAFLPKKVTAYRLLEAWNVTTAVYIQSFDYEVIVHIPDGLFFKHDGSKMYMLCRSSENIYEFDL